MKKLLILSVLTLSFSSFANVVIADKVVSTDSYKEGRCQSLSQSDLKRLQKDAEAYVSGYKTIIASGVQNEFLTDDDGLMTNICAGFAIAKDGQEG